MNYEHLVLSTNIWMTAQYLKYVTKAEYLSYRIQLTLLHSDLEIMNDMRINTSKTQEMATCFCKDRMYVESLPILIKMGLILKELIKQKFPV